MQEEKVPSPAPGPGLQKLKEKRARLNAAIQRAETRERQAARKRDTRRKILLGALIQDIMGRGAVVTTRREIIMAELERFLERDRDRKLFAFPPRPRTPAPDGDG